MVIQGKKKKKNRCYVAHFTSLSLLLSELTLSAINAEEKKKIEETLISSTTARIRATTTKKKEIH